MYKNESYLPDILITLNGRTDFANSFFVVFVIVKRKIL